MAGDRAGRRAGGGHGDGHGHDETPFLEVTEVTVLPAGEEPFLGEPDQGTAADLFPGLLDVHDDDDAGAAQRRRELLERPTWDHRVTPNVVKRTGGRTPRRRG